MSPPLDLSGTSALHRISSLVPRILRSMHEICHMAVLFLVLFLNFSSLGAFISNYQERNQLTLIEGHSCP